MFFRLVDRLLSVLFTSDLGFLIFLVEKIFWNVIILTSKDCTTSAYVFGVWYSIIYFFGGSVSGVEKRGLQLHSSSCFSVQRHWGFSIVELIQLSLPFTVSHYNTIMSTWKYCVPLPRFKYLYTLCTWKYWLLLLWNV